MSDLSIHNIPLQPTSLEIWGTKYQLKDSSQNPIDLSVDDSYRRVAKALASIEEDSTHWEDQFFNIMKRGCTPAGRILSNAGAEAYKPSVSLINCTVAPIIPDSMQGILETIVKSGMTLKAGCGIGYEWSTLRPKNSFVSGAGAYTSGPLSFMDIADAVCFTVSSAGGRRGAQMGTFAVWHPDVEEFIHAKRENGRLRQFNLSLLITDDFIEAVKHDKPWPLYFPLLPNEKALGMVKDSDLIWKPLFWEQSYCEAQGYTVKDGKILCRVYSTIKATALWDTIMKSTYDFAEPGFLLIDKINKYNNNYFCETIRATNPCGEQPLPPEGSCLLGSINIAKYVLDPFKPTARIAWDQLRKDVHVFSRLLDNVVEFSGLPLEAQEYEIKHKRRHGLGFLGLGSAFTLLGLTYGSKESIDLTSEIEKTIAIESLKAGIALAKEKGACPLLQDHDNLVAWTCSEYNKRLFSVAPELRAQVLKYGCRYTHATSIAPTGTIALTVNNNVSNGIEPTFAHRYTRNVIREGRSAKEAVEVLSYEALLYRKITGETEIPDWFSTTDNVSPQAHIDIQAAAQYWCDSSISKTINVPTDTPFEDFKDIYMYAYDKGLKGCTTFRFNPETLQGVLVKDTDLENTYYDFILEDGTVVTTRGDDQIEYDGETHQANNLFDAIKEGYYGKF